MVYVKGNIEVFKEYLLFVSIILVEGVVVDYCCQIIYFIFRGLMDVSNMELFDCIGWEVLSVLFEELKEGDWGYSGLKEVCLDGDLNIFWGIDWSIQYL